jgi:hypothetical protein
MPEHLQEGRSEMFRTLSQGDVEEGVDSQLATSSLALPPAHSPNARDRDFATTQEFWRAVLSEDVRACRTVKLQDVLLSEWFPRSPGLYHTEEAAWTREDARDYVMRLTDEEQQIYQSSDPSDPVVYELYGKMQMLRGGIGCVRLKDRKTADGRLYFMSASTSLAAHEGVPLALTPDQYGRYIEAVTERGVLPCSVTGRLTFLPDSLLGMYRDYVGVPRLYVLVSELVPARSTGILQQGDPTVSVAVMFTADDPWPSVNAAYVSFIPGRNGTLAQRLPWLEHYVSAMHGGSVITDFDEQMTRFPHAVFSLEKIANGALNESEITSVADNLDIHDMQIQRLLAQQRRQQAVTYSIYVRKGGKVGIHMGDEFKNVGAGAVIINRSTVTNALNRIRSDYGPEAAQALQELVDAVERAKQPNATDSLNALTEELDKSQPSKSRLRVWLDAITSALPDVVDVAAAAAKVAQLVL